jgi:hypothetical protein
MLTINKGKSHIFCSWRRQQEASQHPVYVRGEIIAGKFHNLCKLEAVQQLVRWSSANEVSAQHLPELGINWD